MGENLLFWLVVVQDLSKNNLPQDITIEAKKAPKGSPDCVPAAGLIPTAAGLVPTAADRQTRINIHHIPQEPTA